MRIGAMTPIGDIDGFRVEAPGGRIGWVEEMWVDDEGETTAVVVRLPNAQRGLLVRDDIDEILSEELTIAVRPEARFLELEPPHLGTAADGALTASWATSGNALDVPGLLPTAPAVRPASSESSFFRTVAVLYTGLFVIACVLTGLCFLIPYLVSGRPY
jgi:hypothetical protein